MSESYDLRGKRVWVAGHRGMVGAALVRRLAREGCTILTGGRDALDLRRQAETETWIAGAKPDLVFVAAALAGGILANATHPAEFLYENLAIEGNVIHGCHRAGVRRVVFIGSACIYPRLAEQPIAEGTLLSGPLDPSVEWYAVAKIAGIKLCQAYRRQYGDDFISAVPTNLYGPGDSFDLTSSHVVPALIRKVHEAKVRGDPAVTIWGTGSPRRDLLHVDDCADALVHVAKHYADAEPINLGSGEDLTIRDLLDIVVAVVGFEGRVVNDLSKPDGTPRKLLGVDKLRRLGWTPRIGLREGIAEAYAWFVAHEEALGRGERIEARAAN